ncbi:hypothetical protein V2G26_009559 [Clonostachys chloroleuca]
MTSQTLDTGQPDHTLNKQRLPILPSRVATHMHLQTLSGLCLLTTCLFKRPVGSPFLLVGMKNRHSGKHGQRIHQSGDKIGGGNGTRWIDILGQLQDNAGG